MLKRFWSLITHEDLGLTAAALSFTTVLALIPFVAVTLAALNYFHALEALTPKVEFFLLQNLQGTAGNEGVALVRKVIGRIQSGKIGSFGAFILILTSTRMMFELERAFHRIWQVKNRRPLAKRLFFSWMFLILFPFGLALWVAVFSAKTIAQPLSQILPFGSGFLVIFLVLLLLLKLLPSLKVSWNAAIVGSVFSTVLLWVLERSFKFMSAQVFSYGKVYGSLAAIPASLLWIFLIWLSILWGVALSASMQRSVSS
ncbi:MAG: YihY/virulence factor BrkB family protein [Bdellovibrio sp.]